MRVTPNRSLNVATSMRAARPRRRLQRRDFRFQPLQRLVVEQQRVDAHQHLLTLQQLQHPIDDAPAPRRPSAAIDAASGGFSPPSRYARSIARARALFFRRQLEAVRRQRHAVADGDRAGGRQLRQRALEHRRRGRAPNSCSRSSSRGMPSESGCVAVVLGQRRDDRRPSAARTIAAATSTSPARDRLPAATSASTRASTRRGIDAGARDQRRQRQPGGARHRRSSPRRRAAPRRRDRPTAGSKSSRRHRSSAAAAADRGPRRPRIENQAAGNRDRRRIGAQDVAVAAREHGRRFEAQPHERARARRRSRGTARSAPAAARSSATRPRISAVP